MRSFLLIVASAFVMFAASAASPQFTRNRDLPPLKLSVADLDTILRKAHSLIETANGPEGERDYAREYIKVEVAGDEIEIPGHSLTGGTVSVPQAAYDFKYIYIRSDKAISSVIVNLSDNSRRLSVTGVAPDQVEAIASLLESNLLHFSTFAGGSFFRNMVGGLLWIVLSTLLVIGGIQFGVTRHYSALFMPLCAGVALVVLFTAPFDKLLAGFALYQGDTSLLVQYGPEISFGGVVLSLVLFALPYLLSRGKRKRRG